MLLALSGTLRGKPKLLRATGGFLRHDDACLGSNQLQEVEENLQSRRYFR